MSELFTLGEAAGVEASPEEFGRITGVIADGEGNVYVADASAPEVRVFDEQGKFVKRIGRRGSGPGEFVSLQSIGWLGDTLVVMDASGNGRLGLLTRSGEWLGQRQHARISGSSIRLNQTSLHELYTYAPRRTQRLETAYARHTASGSSDTVVTPYAAAPAAAFVSCQHNDGGGISFWTVDFAPRAVRVPGPDRKRVDVWSADYRIAFINSDGDTVRVVSRDVPNVGVTDAEWAQEEERFRKWKLGLPPSACQPATLTRPEGKDLIRGVFFDDASRMWVNLRKGDGFAFDIFDAEGRLLGSIDAPARVEDKPPHIRGNRLYIVTADSLDVQFVKAFALRQ
jgi:hypothetical protein